MGRILSLVIAASTSIFAVAQSPSDELEAVAKRMLEGCRFAATDGTVLYLPDGKSNYQALWTRDFAYMVEYAGDLMPLDHIKGCVDYLLRGQREDGVIPDRVRPDGVAVYVAGPEDHPLGKPNLDNAQFLIIAADEYLARLDEAAARRQFADWGPKLGRGLETIPLGPTGLVYNDPVAPHSPFGFTDCIGKTGNLLMESLLYWEAARRIGVLETRFGSAERAASLKDQATRIEQSVGELWDASAGAFVAATVDCRQVDIWANAYAIWIGFQLGNKRERVLDFLTGNFDRYVQRGQVRHLLEGEYWQRLLTPVEHDRYQNGAYWATASGWVMFAMVEGGRPELAQRILDELLTDFRNSGVWECIHGEYHKLDSYVVSATNPLGAVRRLELGAE